MNTQIIAIANQKGGVGKTTTCANLGIGLAQAGKKVLLIDGDPQGSLTISLGNPQPDKLPFTLSDAMERILMDEPLRPGEGILHHSEGVDLMPADIQLSGMEVSLVNAMSRETILRQYLDTLKGQYSHILIDCQPSLGMLTVNALAAANRIIIPVQAEYLPAKGLEQLLSTVNKVKRQINPKLQIDGILLTMVDSRTNFAKEISALLRETYGSKIKVFGTEIPHSVRAKEISAEGKSIFAHDPGGKVAEGYPDPALSLCEKHFYSLLQPEDVEDLLALWLYDTKGYVCIPSTNKIATLKYECVLVDPNDLNRKHIYIQVKKGDVDLNTDDYSSLNGEVYLLTTEGNVQNTQKYSNVKVADPTVIYEFAINPDKSHIIPENVLYWVKFLTEIENNRLKFSACKGIMFDTNISYSDTNESEMILGNKIAAYGDAKRYIDSFRKDDYALFYSKGRGIIAVGQIVTDTPTEVGDEKNHSVRMIVPENFNGDVKALPALSPNEIKTILKRNFYWASTIKTPFLTGVQVEMLIRELKKKHISAFGKYKIEY